MSRPETALRQLFWRILLRQLEILLAATLLVGWWQGRATALVFLWGGCIALLAQTLASMRTLLRADMRSARHLVNGFFRGESSKLLTVVILMVLTFRLRPDWQVPRVAGFVFAGFVVVQLFSWWIIACQEMRQAHTAKSNDRNDRESQ